jgi:hypothetical protein
LVSCIGSSFAASELNMQYRTSSDAVNPLFKSTHDDFKYSADGTKYLKNNYGLHFIVNFYVQTDTSLHRVNSSSFNVYPGREGGNILIPDDAQFLEVICYTGVFNKNNSNEYYGKCPGENQTHYSMFLIDRAGEDKDKLPVLTFSILKSDSVLSGLEHYVLSTTGGHTRSFPKV